MPWVGGFFLSCLFIWGVAALFCDSVVPVEEDAFFGRPVRKSGITIRKRTEGWATTRVGAHGLIADGAEVLGSQGRKFIFWGDSHGEGFQVNDSDKAMTVFNALPNRVGMQGVTSAASGLSVADYYYDLGRFEEMSPEVLGHVILLNGLLDVLPDTYLDCHSRFMAEPWRLEESHCMPSENGLRFGPWIYSLRMGFAYELYKRICDYQFHFGLTVKGNAPKPSSAAEIQDINAGWDFLLGSLRKRTEGFLVFIYCPMVPDLKGGGLNRRDAEAPNKDAFARACTRNGVGFVDLTQDFFDFYDRNKKFPRGFFNSIPGAGHLNKYGHALVAKGLNDYLRQVGK